VKVIWAELALQDIEEIWAYIARDSRASATKTIGKIRHAARRLIQHPETGRPGRAAGTRELVVPGTPYILPYRMKGNALEILAVIHGKQDCPGPTS
jgi:toxin ParE1/3/4